MVICQRSNWISVIMHKVRMRKRLDHVSKMLQQA